MDASRVSSEGNALSRAVLSALERIFPKLGQTEREALEAGTVGWDGELFSGAPDWQSLLDTPVRGLSAEEQAFLDGPVEELCRRLDDWQIFLDGDLPPRVWSLLREQRFFGMIIPKEWGGLGFSAAAHSAVVVKLASRCVACAVTVMVPNSLGPAELLLHYGTDEQRRSYLPRLARGEEIPCFALTGPKREAMPRRCRASASSAAGHSREERCSASACAGASATSRWRRSRR